MSGKLEQAKANYIEKLKRVKLIEAGIDYNDVSTYVKYISATSKDGIKKEAEEIVADINQQTQFSDGYQAPRSWNPFKK